MTDAAKRLRRAAVTVPRPLTSRMPKPPPPDDFSPEKLPVIFESLQPASVNHRFILERCGVADRLRVVPGDSSLKVHRTPVAGCLAVPVRSLEGHLHAIQFISGSGDELSTGNAATQHDGMFIVGEMDVAQSLYVCERLQDAWSCFRAMKTAAVVVFDTRQMSSVIRAIRDRYKAVKIVLVSTRGKESDFQIVARHAACSFVAMPVGSDLNFGAHDFERANGGAALATLLSNAVAPLNRYVLESADELTAAPPLEWLVAGVLPAQGLAAIYGPSRSGKSFLAFDLCASVASGTGWFGRRVSAAPVTYLILEGAAGFGKRVMAWNSSRRTKLTDRLRFVRDTLDLRNRAQVMELAASINAHGMGGGLVVIDTLSQASSGADENSSADMGELIAGCNTLQKAVGGLVVMVHHTGKDGAKGLRGHSSLLAALDAAIEVKWSGGKREWVLAKSKDDIDGGRNSFRLEPVSLGTDENGDAVTSCLVTADDAIAKPTHIYGPRGKNEELAFGYLQEAFATSQDLGQGGAPSTVRCVNFSAAVLAVSKSITSDARHRKERAKEAINGLVARRVINMTNGGWLWRT